MDRANAYAALATELEQWRLRSAAELASCIGAAPVVRRAEVQGEVVSIEVSVAWADAAQRRFKVEAIANGPSHWATERLVERITVVARSPKASVGQAPLSFTAMQPAENLTQPERAALCLEVHFLLYTGDSLLQQGEFLAASERRIDTFGSGSAHPASETNPVGLLTIEHSFALPGCPITLRYYKGCAAQDPPKFEENMLMLVHLSEDEWEYRQFQPYTFAYRSRPVPCPAAQGDPADAMPGEPRNGDPVK